MNSATKKEIQWWIDNIEVANCKIDKGSPVSVITTDASSLGGWGGVLSQSITAGGRRTNEEKVLYTNNINALKLLAVYFSLPSFKKDIIDKHIKILSKNQT